MKGEDVAVWCASPELFSQLYDLLGDRSSMPDGDVWRHEPLQRLTADILRIAQALADQRAAADDGLRARVAELFEGGPDTVCRTTWRREAGWSLPGASVPLTECVEVPLDALRAALDPPTAEALSDRPDHRT